jgi:glycosyltransferase involved in cell wall biosynthesis
MAEAPNTRVSVLVSTYDRPALLRASLQSILAQTYDDYDVLVWNDGGPAIDGTVPELADPRVRYHHNTENQGVMAAVAGGLRKLTGEYIAHMDDDDEWDPRFLAAHVALLDENPSASVSFCDHWVMSEDGTLEDHATVENSRHWGRLALAPGLHEPAYEVAFRGSIPMASAALVRRSALDLQDMPPQLRFAWDLWVSYMAVRGGAGAVYEPRRLARKRRHARQMMSAVAPTANLADLVLIYERMLQEPTFAVDRERLAAKLSDAAANHAIALLRDGDPAAARVASRRGLRVRRTPRAAAAVAAAAMPAALSGALARGASSALARRRRLTRASLLGRGSY